MAYRVVWLQSAETELALLWDESVEKHSILSAANQIERQLADRPNLVGESRPEGRRILHVAPLGVVYRVVEEDRVVSVLRVWYVKPRRKD